MCEERTHKSLVQIRIQEFVITVFNILSLGVFHPFHCFPRKELMIVDLKKKKGK